VSATHCAHISDAVDVHEKEARGLSAQRRAKRQVCSTSCISGCISLHTPVLARSAHWFSSSALFHLHYCKSTNGSTYGEGEDDLRIREDVEVVLEVQVDVTLEPELRCEDQARPALPSLVHPPIPSVSWFLTPASFLR
jgi:hypothetical protein